LDEHFFLDPFIWLFTRAAPTLLFTPIQREAFMGQFGFDLRHDRRFLHLGAAGWTVCALRGLLILI
jgi:hypothetical protein